MRNLTHDEIVELRACKDMLDPRKQLYARLKRFFADDSQALAEIEKLENLAKEVEALPEGQDITNSKSSQAHSQSSHMYFKALQSFLEGIGYTPERDKEVANDNKSLWDYIWDSLTKYDKKLDKAQYNGKMIGFDD
ncbi:MAG TPA: hypothetical protein DCS54_03385 [Oribacterium sp.]|jgi:hypothetical protein|nr:hypothetical protein [Oribacterium sp.]